MADDGPLRCILVGAGGFGQVWWDLNRSNLGARVVAVVDPDSQALSRSATELALYPTDQFPSLDEALQTVEADAVIDSSPPDFHLPHARLAFARGLHLFTAKPMASTWADAVEMTRLANQSGRVLAVNEQLRFGWLPLAISNALQAGDIGKVVSLELAFREPSAWHGWRASMEHPLLLDAAIQHFDMVRAVTGLEVESASCQAWRTDWSSFAGCGSASAILRLDGGVTFTYTGVWELSDVSDATGWWGEWRIQGSSGDLRAAGKRGLWINGHAAPVAVEPLDVRRLSRVVFDQFVRTVRTGAPAPTEGWNDLHSLAFSELCIQSARTGAPARVEDLDPPLSSAQEPSDPARDETTHPAEDATPPFQMG